MRPIRFAVIHLTFVLAIVSLGCQKKPILDEAAQALVDARKAIDDGDSTAAIELLTGSIEAGPSPWSYYERAKLYAEAGDDDLAKADIQAGLELDSEHSDLLWLEKQMKKSQKARFKKPPPSVNK